MKCKICKSSKIRDLFYSINAHGRHIVDSKEKFLISKCDNCDAIFPSVKIGKDYYNKYYELGYYDDRGVKKNSLLDKFLTFISGLSNARKERLILNALNNKHNKVSILDIGCGNGNFLSALNSMKFDKYGVEINREGYEMSKKKGLNVFYGDVKEVDFGNKKFDAVSLWHVLEHIDDPHALFSVIDKILMEKGVLIFQIPNTDSFGFRFGRKYWFHLDTPRHLMLYGEKTVRALCKLKKFEIISVINEFYEYPLDLFWSVRKSGMRFLCYPLYPVVKFLDRETLTYVCKKKDTQ